MKLRALVVDDEEFARKNLTMLLEEYCPEIDVIGEAAKKESAKALIESSKPDVVFLDIRMPSGAEGFELLEEVENKDFVVVFVCILPFLFQTILGCGSPVEWWRGVGPGSSSGSSRAAPSESSRAISAAVRAKSKIAASCSRQRRSKGARAHARAPARADMHCTLART